MRVARHTTSSGEALGELGWRPEVSLEDLLSRYVEWVRQQPDLADFYAHSQAQMREAGILRRTHERDPS